MQWVGNAVVQWVGNAVVQWVGNAVGMECSYAGQGMRLCSGCPK